MWGRSNMTDMQKDLMKKLLGVLFMDWKEEWGKGDLGTMSGTPPFAIKNGNPLSCTRHEGCPCDGGEKLRAMFGTDELEELYGILEQMNK
jgi:hypothetical protein|tara:strand:- start:2713 stop:2982 length:270 start_codon:yes stop_codon:yes gene_type:complete